MFSTRRLVLWIDVSPGPRGGAQVRNRLRNPPHWMIARRVARLGPNLDRQRNSVAAVRIPERFDAVMLRWNGVGGLHGPARSPVPAFAERDEPGRSVNDAPDWPPTAARPE